MKKLPIILAGATLFILACVCSSSPSTPSNAPVVVGNATDAPANPPSVQTFQIGEIIQTGSSTVTLNSASIQGSTLQANFTIENQGNQDLNISSLLLFEAKDDNGTKLDQEIFECASGGLDDTVLPGDKLRGNICWNGVVSDAVKIYYNANLFSASGTTVVWQVSR